jgi:hypothetical protein
MVQSTAQPAVIPFVEDVTVKDSFADSCAGISFTNGNLHMTFVSVTADHARDPAPTKRIVTGRLVMPIAGVIDLRDTITRMIDMLTAQGIIAPVPSTPTVVTPPQRPH